LSHLSERFPTAFVTGASAGLGRAFVEMLLAENVRVWGTARDAGRLTDLALRWPAQFTPVILDLAEPAPAEAAFQRAMKSAGGVFDLLINNAGYGVFGGFDETDPEVWAKQIAAMLSSTMRLTHSAMRAMRARNRGCLVNISSLAVEFPLPYMSGYNVAKAGLAALSESLIVETRGTNLTVIDFRPGDYRTDFNLAMQSASPAASAPNSPAAKAWRILEDNLRSAPSPARAAADLRRALLRSRSGTIRSGAFFQARFASFFAPFLPAKLRRALAAKYFGL
jgi:short-subunit dehydrogenase